MGSYLEIETDCCVCSDDDDHNANIDTIVESVVKSTECSNEFDNKYDGLVSLMEDDCDRTYSGTPVYLYKSSPEEEHAGKHGTNEGELHEIIFTADSSSDRSSLSIAWPSQLGLT